jgi:hypothetical protein
MGPSAVIQLLRWTFMRPPRRAQGQARTQWYRRTASPPRSRWSMSALRAKPQPRCKACCICPMPAPTSRLRTRRWPARTRPTAPRTAINFWSHTPSGPSKGRLSCRTFFRCLRQGTALLCSSSTSQVIRLAPRAPSISGSRTRRRPRFRCCFSLGTSPRDAARAGRRGVFPRDVGHWV